MPSKLMLAAGKMAKCKDFDKGQIVFTNLWRRFRVLIESRHRRVRDVLTAKRGPTQYLADVHNVMADLCTVDKVTLLRTTKTQEFPV